MSINFSEELNEEQLKVVQNGDGPTLVLAGAGSGKTRTLVYRVAHLLEQGVRPYEILLVTFTNKAASEMTERMEHLLGYRPTGLWSGTFHSIANRLLRQHAEKLGYGPNYTILDQDDAKSLMKICVKDAKISKARRFPSPRILLSLGSFARNASITLEQTVTTRNPTFIELVPDIERVLNMYEQKKRESNSMDFDDLLLNLHELLVECPEVEDQLANRFKYILVDEYQDTNTLQANIVTRLAKVHRNLLVVGDDAQSIYSFRAANIQNILKFPNLFASSQTFRLETNYRSTPEILRLANESILYNQDQFEKELRAHNPKGRKPKRTAHRSPRLEASYIADQIMSHLEGGVAPREISVLFRAAYQSQALEFELMKRGVSYEYRGGMRFFERAHIKDALAFLRIQENVKDTAAWMRVLGMQVGVGPATAQKIIAIVKEVPQDAWFTDAVYGALPKRAAEGWRMAATMIEPVLTRTTISDQIRALATTPYVEYLEHQYTNASDRLTDVDQLSLFAAQYTDRSAFLEEVTLSDIFGNDKTAPMAQIVLSTIHQSKGLEWDVVFVMSLTDGGFPSRRSLEDERAIEEERRLFYVAVTRARKHLHLTYPTVGMGDGFQGLTPSMFLEELSPDVVDTDRPASTGRSYLRPVTKTYDDAYQGDFTDKEEAIDLDIF